MEDYGMLLGESLVRLKQTLNERYYHWFDVWFGRIDYEGYDPDTHTLTLRVPSDYIYEFLESNGRKQMLWILEDMFKEQSKQVQLSYLIMEKVPEPDFTQLVAQMKYHGFNAGGVIPQVCIPDAERRMRDCLKEFVGEDYQWVPAYDKVAAWLSDNRGKWLLCIGFSGTGKSRLCRNILPFLLGFKNVAVCSAIEMTAHDRIDELLKADIIVVDGLGTESPETNLYGRHRRPFAELCEAAEQDGKLLILTTNCLATRNMPDDWPCKSQFPVTFGERYGEDVLSRLRSHTVNVTFKDVLRKDP